MFEIQKLLKSKALQSSIIIWEKLLYEVCQFDKLLNNPVEVNKNFFTLNACEVLYALLRSRFINLNIKIKHLKSVLMIS